LRTGEGWHMFRIAIVLTALFFAIAAHAEDNEIIANGKAAVIAKLINPGSARFRDVRLTTNNGQQFVCGHVGAQNRKGVYDDKPFVFIPNQKDTRHSAIIYGGHSITDDRFSNFAEPTVFAEICGS
jgi:hypothetical protein